MTSSLEDEILPYILTFSRMFRLHQSEKKDKHVKHRVMETTLTHKKPIADNLNWTSADKNRHKNIEVLKFPRIYFCLKK